MTLRHAAVGLAQRDAAHDRPVHLGGVADLEADDRFGRSSPAIARRPGSSSGVIGSPSSSNISKRSSTLSDASISSSALSKPVSRAASSLANIEPTDASRTVMPSSIDSTIAASWSRDARSSRSMRQAR